MLNDLMHLQCSADVISTILLIPVFRFQLVDFGLAHAVQTKEELSAKPSSKPRGRTAMRGESSNTVSKVNGIAPPSTYSRQLHLRAAARGQRATTSKGRASTSKGNATTSKGRAKPAAEGGEVRLCPIRHKLSEVCNICMSR